MGRVQSAVWLLLKAQTLEADGAATTRCVDRSMVEQGVAPLACYSNVSHVYRWPYRPWQGHRKEHGCDSRVEILIAPSPCVSGIDNMCDDKTTIFWRMCQRTEIRSMPFVWLGRSVLTGINQNIVDQVNLVCRHAGQPFNRHGTDFRALTHAPEHCCFVACRHTALKMYIMIYIHMHMYTC